MVVTTKQDSESLPPCQEAFLQTYLATGNKTKASEAAGVHRSTPYEWFKSDFRFQAELNRRRRERAEEARLRLFALSGKAIDVISHSLDNDHVGTAWKVLEYFGESIGTAGPEDPDELEIQAKTAALHRQRLKQLELENEQFLVAMDKAYPTPNPGLSEFIASLVESGQRREGPSPEPSEKEEEEEE
jgi:hypothetical protein